MSYTTSDLLTNIKTRAAVPTSQSTFTTTKILAMADAEMRTYIMPMLISTREYYLAYDYETTVNASGLYAIPTRAVGAKLINACLIDGTSRLDLNWITEDELVRTDMTRLGSPGIFLKRNTANLLPPTSHGFGSIRLTYNIRPGQFIETSSASQITAINTGTFTLTFASLPTAFLTSVNYDMVQQNPHFDALAIDQTATTITSTTMIFSSLPSSLAVGDWVSIANQTCIVQVPVELQPLLEQKAANTLLRSQGDLEASAAGEKELKRMEE